MKYVPGICFVCVLTLGGCQTLDPYTGETKTSNTAKGAGIGAVAGAILGAATSSKKDRKKGALTGALIGGAIGGGVGNYMDRQEAALRQRLEGTGVRVQREGDNLRLIMPGNITFDTNQSAVKSSFYPTLNSVTLVLKEFAQTSIQVSGHTDSTGSASLNQQLSQSRANSVSQYLASQGINAGRIQAVGYSFQYPVASNDTAQGRAQNRRVEINIIPNQ